jgi:hypothetical protein
MEGEAAGERGQRMENGGGGRRRSKGRRGRKETRRPVQWQENETQDPHITTHPLPIPLSDFLDSSQPQRTAMQGTQRESPRVTDIK